MEIAYGNLPDHSPRAGNVAQKTSQPRLPNLISQLPFGVTSVGIVLSSGCQAHLDQDDVVEIIDHRLPVTNSSANVGSCTQILDSDTPDSTSQSPSIDPYMHSLACSKRIVASNDNSKENNKGGGWSDSDDDIWTIPVKRGRKQSG